MMKESGLDTLSDKEFIRTKGLGADVISFWHVLEHVEKPEEYLDAARNNLKKGGKIIIGVPNIDSFEFKFSKQYWFHLQPQFHLWHYSPSSLKKLLQKSKFKINTIDYWSIEHHLTGVLQTFINKFSGSKENVLHRLVKRSAGGSKVRLGDIFWSGFFLTLGAPSVKKNPDQKISPSLTFEPPALLFTNLCKTFSFDPENLFINVCKTPVRWCSIDQ